MKGTNEIQYKASALSAKLEGMAYLMRSFRPVDSGPRDMDARYGIALIFEDMAKDSMEISELLEQEQR